MGSNTSTTTSLTVLCLCAAWCDTCRQYQTTFAAVQKAHPQHVFEWLDIESEAFEETALEVENFPTLWIGNADQALFYGTALPHQSVLEKMIEKGAQNNLAITDAIVQAEAHMIGQMLRK